MKKISENKIDSLLSAYLDNALSDSEKKEVEALLETDQKVLSKLEALRNLKNILASKRKIEPNIGFWTKLSTHIEDVQREESNYLPFPRKYIPAVSVLTVIVVILFGTVLIQKREFIFNYISEKSHIVKNAYDGNAFQNSLLPLFSKVDKDKALQFSLFGTLSIDDKSGTTLQVDEHSEKGYRIEVGKTKKKKTKSITFENFIAEVKPTVEQKKIIDSLLELTGKRIESSVLIGENNTMAIAPDLPPLNRIMLTNIASCLKPAQREKFEKLLEIHNSPYTVINKNNLAGNRKNTLPDIAKEPLNNRFVIITPDTLIYSQIKIDFDSIRKQIEENFSMIEMRREAMLKRMMSREFRNVRRNINTPNYLSPFDNDKFISVEISAPVIGLVDEPAYEIVRPRLRKQIMIQDEPNRLINKNTDTNTIPFK